MKKTFILLVSVCIATMTMAQAPDGVFAKASVAPVIDGVVDAVWAGATVYNIDKPFKTEAPTLGASGETTWQAMWNAEGVYVLLKVMDDAFYPNYLAPGYVEGANGFANWQFDKPELYFNVNGIVKDGFGGSVPGHYQLAPGFTDGKNDGTPITLADGVTYAMKVTGSNYIAEYFIPNTKLIDNAGLQFDKTGTIGFDVTIIDRDPYGTTTHQRAVWANIGDINESNSNMDDIGHVTFEGAEMAITIDEVTLNTGGTITADNGTLQMVATILPLESISPIKWTVVNGTGRATIDNKGLLKGIADGTVSVKATAVDAMLADDMVDVVISGQVVTRTDVSMVKDGFFDDSTRAAWSKGTVADGILVCDPLPPVVNSNAWDWVTTQIVAVSIEDKDVPYIFTFKAWADAVRTFNVDFEDSGNSRYGYSSDTQSTYGTSDWTFDVTTTPTIYVFHVTFSNMKENSNQSMNFMLGLADQPVYLDSVMLLKESDYNLYTSSKKSLIANTLNVYPNPIDANNQLTVELASANVKVSIYNAIGQKMMEKVSTGNVARFDVSNLHKGMYFIKLDDGTTQKFVK